MGLTRSPHVEAPKMASLYFWWHSRDSCCIAMMEPPVSCLESTFPAATCQMAIVFDLTATLILLVVSHLFENPLLPPSPRPPLVHITAAIQERGSQQMS